MSDLEYRRCPDDDWKAGSAEVGNNPDTGQPIEININGVSSVMSIQACLMALGAAMKAGHEEDFLEKITLCLYGKVIADPHSLCPLITILGSVMMLISDELVVKFGKDNQVQLVPMNETTPNKSTCIYDDDEGDDDELHEGPRDGTGGTDGGDSDAPNNGPGSGDGIAG